MEDANEPDKLRRRWGLKLVGRGERFFVKRGRTRPRVPNPTNLFVEDDILSKLIFFSFVVNHAFVAGLAGLFESTQALTMIMLGLGWGGLTEGKRDSHHRRRVICNMQLAVYSGCRRERKMCELFNLPSLRVFSHKVCSQPKFFSSSPSLPTSFLEYSL